MQPAPKPQPAPVRRIVVATPIDPDQADALARVSWPRTLLRLAVQPSMHPWQRGWRLRNRAPLAVFAAAVLLLLLFAASGCSSTPLLSLAQDGEVPRPLAGAHCDSLIVSQELPLPREGEVGEVRVTLRDLPPALGRLRILVRQPRFPASLDLDGPAAFDKILDAPADARELTLLLSRPKRARGDWPRSYCRTCRVEAELTGFFGAREGLQDFFQRALQEAQAIDRGFSHQTAEKTDTGLQEAGARLLSEAKRCGVQLDKVVNGVYAALAQLDEARAAFYAADLPQLPDPAAVARAFREAAATVDGVPAAAAAWRETRWPAALNLDGPLRSSMLHLHLALQARQLPQEQRDAAARWIVLATAPDADAIARRSRDLPKIRDLRDAEARLAWVDPQPEATLPLPGYAPATLKIPWFHAAPHGRRCIGPAGAAPVRDAVAEAASVASLLGGAQKQLRIARVGDVATATVTLARAGELLCDSVGVDVEPLFAGLEDRELGAVAERLETIVSEARGNEPIEHAVAARASKLLCKLLSADTVQRRVTSVAGYKIFVDGGTHILELVPGPLVCEGRAVSAREVRARLRDAYRGALDSHALADKLCPMRGGKCPEEVAASVRRLFGLRGDALAQVAPVDSKALDFPPPFGFSDAWVDKLDKCGRESCDALSRLREAAPAGQFEGALCAPAVEGDAHLQDITLDRPDVPTSVTLSSCDAHAGVRLTLRRKADAGTLVSIASAHPFRYGSENVTRQGRHPQLGRIFERVADLGDRSDVTSRADGAFEVAVTPTVENQVFWFFTLRRRDY